MPLLDPPLGFKVHASVRLHWWNIWRYSCDVLGVLEEEERQSGTSLGLSRLRRRRGTFILFIALEAMEKELRIVWFQNICKIVKSYDLLAFHGNSCYDCDVISSQSNWDLSRAQNTRLFYLLASLLVKYLRFVYLTGGYTSRVRRHGANDGEESNHRRQRTLLPSAHALAKNCFRYRSCTYNGKNKRATEIMFGLSPMSWTGCSFQSKKKNFWRQSTLLFNFRK